VGADPLESFGWAIVASLVVLPVTWYHYPVALMPIALAGLNAQPRLVERPYADPPALLGGRTFVADAAILAPVLLWAAVALLFGVFAVLARSTWPRGFGVVLMATSFRDFRAASRAILAEPPRPPSAGAGLEPGFRAALVCVVLSFQPHSSSSGCSTLPLGLPGRRLGSMLASTTTAPQHGWRAGTHGPPVQLLNGREFSYAGLPPTVVMFAPATLLPKESWSGSGWPSRWPRPSL